MSERRVPLGTTYNNSAGDDVISFPVTLRIVRYEVRDTLADFFVTQRVIGQRVPAASSFGVRKVRELLESEYTSRGGSGPGDETATADDGEQDKAYDWAEKVLSRVWPS